MQTKIKKRAYISLVHLIFMICALFFLIITFGEGFNSKNGALFLSFILFIIVLALYFDIRDKSKIRFEVDQILINRFLGLGHTIVIGNRDIDGFHTSEVYDKYGGSYDYIYLIKGKQKIAKISDAYLENFEETKLEISNKFKDLGFIKTDFITDLKDLININK